MQYALFIAEYPTSASNEDKSNWKNFIMTAKEKLEEENSSVSMFNEGTYLCNLSRSFPMLSMLVLCAREWKVSSRTLFFDQEPSWVITPNA